MSCQEETKKAPNLVQNHGPKLVFLPNEYDHDLDLAQKITLDFASDQDARNYELQHQKYNSHDNYEWRHGFDILHNQLLRQH